MWAWFKFLLLKIAVQEICRMLLYVVYGAHFLTDKKKAFGQNLAVMLKHLSAFREIPVLLDLCEKWLCGLSELFNIPFVDKPCDNKTNYFPFPFICLYCCALAPLFILFTWVLNIKSAIHSLGNAFKSELHHNADQSSSQIILLDQSLLYYELWLAAFL